VAWCLPPERMRGAAMTATGRAVAGLTAAAIVAGTALAAAPPAMSAARRAQADAAAARTPASNCGEKLTVTTPGG